MKKQFTISIFTEDNIGLLNRVSIVFTRRHINIESITASESEVPKVHRYTIVITEPEELVIKVVKQLEKQVEVLKAFYHDNTEIVHQEIALYKIPTSVLCSSHAVEKLVRAYGARILTIESDFAIIEKVGYKEETQELYEVLSQHGILEFVRSGRVAITKPMKELRTYMEEIENELKPQKNHV